MALNKINVQDNSTQLWIQVHKHNVTAYTENHEMQSQMQNSTQLQTPMQPYGSKQRQEDPIPTRDGSLKTRMTKTRPRVVVLRHSMIKHINDEVDQ